MEERETHWYTPSNKGKQEGKTDKSQTLQT